VIELKYYMIIYIHIFFLNITYTLKYRLNPTKPLLKHTLT